MNTTKHTMTLLAHLAAHTYQPSSFPLAQSPSLINYQGRRLDGTNLTANRYTRIGTANISAAR